jgi:hypothetical protein
MVHAVIPTPDGNYYIGGSGFARLKNNGSRDTTFTPPTPSPLIYALALQNGKLFVGGHAYLDPYALRRLTSSGAADSSFATGTNVEISPPTALWNNFQEVDALAIQADGNSFSEEFSISTTE